MSEITETYHCPPNVDCPCYTKMWDEIDRLRAEIERLRAGGCARDQTTTQYCAEAARLAAENERLRTALREAFEVYAGSDGFIPETAAEGYQQQVIKQIINCINAGLAHYRTSAMSENMMQWQPIDVEPSHTMRVLLFRPSEYDPDWDGADYGISVGYFSNGEWRDQGTNHDAFEYTAPTHWMPLPPPPEDKSDG